MAYYVEQAVLALGVKIVFAEVEDFDNSKDSPEWEAQREERLAKLIDCWTGKDLHADPMLEGFHILHDHALCGWKRSRGHTANKVTSSQLHQERTGPWHRQTTLRRIAHD